MYIKKITFKAFKDYLKNPTDFFLEGNIFISDDIAKYCRLVRTPAAKGEHNVEVLYGKVQLTYHPERNISGRYFHSNASLDFMGYIVDGETIYSARAGTPFDVSAFCFADNEGGPTCTSAT